LPRCRAGSIPVTRNIAPPQVGLLGADLEESRARQPDTPKRFRLAGDELDREPERRVGVGEEPDVGLDPQRVAVDADEEIADALRVPSRDEHGNQGA
jgi:hypothetical protein